MGILETINAKLDIILAKLNASPPLNSKKLEAPIGGGIAGAIQDDKK